MGKQRKHFSEELRKVLAKKLKNIRGARSQVAFAKELGISKSSLNRIEIAEQNVALDTLDIICRRLKIDIGDLFEER
jgi:DNA-binding Xre family transcriptional regulator